MGSLKLDQERLTALYDAVHKVIPNPDEIDQIAKLARIPQHLVEKKEAQTFWYQVIQIASQQRGCLPRLVERIEKHIEGWEGAAELRQELANLKRTVGTPAADKIKDDVNVISTSILVLIGQSDPLTSVEIIRNSRLAVVNIYGYLDDPSSTSKVMPGLVGESDLRVETLIERCLTAIAALDKFGIAYSSGGISPRVSDDRRDDLRHSQAYLDSLIDAKTAIIRALRTLKSEIHTSLIMPN